MDLNRTLMLTIFIVSFFFTAQCRHISRHHRGRIVERQLTNGHSNRLLASSKNRFEGDILVRKTSAGSQESAVFQDRVWPDAKIPYQISNDYNQREKSMILNAMNEIHAKTCVRFSPRTTERHFIDISKANSGCSSYVGRQGGSQVVSLEDECFNPRIVKHELMHAIGFYHEQSRTDRDDYVVVHFDNVNFGLDANFQKYDSTQVQSLRTPYDIKSIMHYGWNAFARDTSRPTITAKNGGARIEPSNDFTETDILDINRLYDCNQGGGGNKGDWKKGKNGGFLWQDNCVFVAGNVRDIIVVDSSKDDCGIKCQEWNGCVHFTWNGVILKTDTRSCL